MIGQLKSTELNQTHTLHFTINGPDLSNLHYPIKIVAISVLLLGLYLASKYASGFCLILHLFRVSEINKSFPCIYENKDI